jgi:hypothetical protein
MRTGRSGTKAREMRRAMTEQEQTVREIGRRMAKGKARIVGFNTVFPAGTILLCSDCGEGLYKVTPRATTADILLDNGTILQPLSMTIST